MKTQIATLHNEIGTDAMTEAGHGRRPALAVPLRLLLAAALVLPTLAASAGAVLTTLHSFQFFPNGQSPNGLVEGIDGYFYGTTIDGGTNGDNGTVFKISTSGALTTLYSFGSIQSTNGLSLDGATPDAPLLQGSDGNFYGTTINGGTNGDNGTVFKISADGKLTTLHSFTGGSDGSLPTVLVASKGGDLYGTTVAGGTHTNFGTVFKITTDGAFTSIYSFTGGSDGSDPSAGLVLGNDGNFYGTTRVTLDGSSGGTVFRITTNGSLTTLHSFDPNANDGSLPNGLAQGSDGFFYGTTSIGGTNGAGTVFKISTNGALTTLYSFGSIQSANGVSLDGARPDAPLLQGSDGYFYGTTSNGGTNDGYGTVFKISTNGALTTLYFFGSITNASGDALDGANLAAGLVQGSDGYFYGTTFNGGKSGDGGTVFRISTNGTLTSLQSFAGSDGSTPEAGLVQGSDGDFYGATHYPSTVFKISAHGALTRLHLFARIGDDGAPIDSASGLVQGSDGYFYGTTEYGGTNDGNGTVFKISTNGALTTLYSFGSIQSANGVSLDGARPDAPLLQGSDGYFYGTTSDGGTHTNLDYTGGLGTVFKITTNGALTTLYSFGTIQDVYGNPLDGAFPSGGLVQGSDGNFYGTTYAGGDPNFSGSFYSLYGTVFKISTNGALTTLYYFGSITNASGDALDGAYPMASLVQGSDGSFYGTTSMGGQGGAGTVFRLTIVPEFQTATLANGTLSLSWSTEAGGTYQLQYNTDLSSSNWTNLESAVTATGGTLSTTDSITNGPQRFYRLVEHWQ